MGLLAFAAGARRRSEPVQPRRTDSPLSRMGSHDGHAVIQVQRQVSVEQQQDVLHGLAHRKVLASRQHKFQAVNNSP